ncbi:transmembrane and immunoglobulin domain-containing protein 1 [Rhinichthys klamathensis goyatoka]|uniref:transmembrane and immunoglobulin domain-containing protein 1 n=1 Tax=Rhinichthys klamathensis goyatoka TaxID=3034132 RepID=UPI0024B5A527|nr:transmembrane and immunoglobulin domain-containing protein 1 [Rhinichthys klamathensis goyatoka]
MKVLVIILFLLCCVSPLKAVTIESCPLAIGSLLKTEVEETVTLTCKTDESIDPSNYELQWYRNGAQVNLAEENRLSRSNLCVQSVTKEDNGVVFTCQLKGDASVNGSIEFDVHYPPDLNDTKEVFVEEKDDVVLSCDVRANPPVALVWKRDGEVLDLTTGSYITTNNGITAELSIRKAERDVHQGTYICEVTSPVYGIAIRTFTVTVEDRVLKFPLGPTIAGVVVVLCTIVLALISRRDKIIKCCKRN